MRKRSASKCTCETETVKAEVKKREVAEQRAVCVPFSENAWSGLSEHRMLCSFKLGRPSVAGAMQCHAMRCGRKFSERDASALGLAVL